MTILLSSENCYAELAWTGAEDSFAPNFVALDAAHVLLKFRNEDDEVVPLSAGVHLALTVPPGGGTVTAAPLALPPAPGVVIFERETPAIQETDFATLGAFTADVHTLLHTKAAMRDAEIRRRAKLDADIEAAVIASAAAAAAAQLSQAQIFALLALSNLVYFRAEAPDDEFGKDGDVYVNTAVSTWPVYGPKAAGVWGSFVGQMLPVSGDLLSSNNLTDLASRQAGHDNLSLKGSDIASAATVNLDAATGSLLDITGTTAITAITLAEGLRRIVRFTGVLTLTNGASLVLPGGANIQTAGGDFAIFAGYAGGVVRCVAYLPASGARSDLIVTLAGAQTIAGNKTFTGLNKIQALKEKWNIVAGALSAGDNNIDALTAAAWYYSSNGTTNAGVNLRGDGSNTLNSLLAVGESITVSVMIKNGGTAYYINSVKIDGTTSGVTTEWLGGAAPSAGTVNKKDAYTFTVLKTADATFLVEASFAKGN